MSLQMYGHYPPAPPMFPMMQELSQSSFTSSMSSSGSNTSREPDWVRPLRNKTGDLPKVLSTDFERTKRLGEGSHSIVSKAKDPSTGKSVALKTFKTSNVWGGGSGSSSRGTMVHALINELKNMNRIERHMHVIRPLSVCTDELTYVMECGDTDLGQLIYKRGKDIPMDGVWVLMGQIASGLAHIHAMGVLHLDIKSSNIMLTREHVAKIGDFGNSRACQQGGELAANFEMVTIWYRPPELLMGARTVTAKADVWSLATIVMEMLTGKPNFSHGDYTNSTCQCHPNYNSTQLKAVLNTHGTPPKGMSEFRDMPAYHHFKHLNSRPSALEYKIIMAIEKRMTHFNLRVKGPSHPYDPAWWMDLLTRMFEFRPERRCTAADVIAAIEPQGYRMGEISFCMKGEKYRSVGRPRLADLPARAFAQGGGKGGRALKPSNGAEKALPGKETLRQEAPSKGFARFFVQCVTGPQNIA